jgi:hypothetical protein
VQHDLLDAGPYCHGLRLGASLDDFLAAWARVAFADPRDWRKLTTADAPISASKRPTCACSNEASASVSAVAPPPLAFDERRRDLRRD